jgi:AmpD protein
MSLPPGQFVGSTWIDDLFTNRLDPYAHPYFAEIAHLRVSAHFLIERNGTLTQYVPLHLQAWHAGVSAFDGRANCNDYSVGVELEGDEVTPYAQAQYDALIFLVRLLRHEYPAITAERIVGHRDVAPGRKTDPGAAFDWQRLHCVS